MKPQIKNNGLFIPFDLKREHIREKVEKELFPANGKGGEVTFMSAEGSIRVKWIPTPKEVKKILKGEN